MDLHDLEACSGVGERDRDDPVEPAGAQKGRIQHIDPVGRRHDPDVAAVPEPVHLGEKLHQRPLDLGAPGGPVVGAHTPDRIDLVDEDDRRSALPGEDEEFTHELRALSDVLVDEFAPGHPDEPCPGLAGDRLCNQGLSRAGRPVEEDAFRGLHTYALVDLGFRERILDGFPDLLDLFFQTADLLERHVWLFVKLHDPDSRIEDVADRLDDRERIVHRHLHPGLEGAVEFLVDRGDVFLVVALLPEIHFAILKYIDHSGNKQRHLFELTVFFPKLQEFLLEQPVFKFVIQDLRLQILNLEGEHVVLAARSVGNGFVHVTHIVGSPTTL